MNREQKRVLARIAALAGVVLVVGGVVALVAIPKALGQELGIVRQGITSVTTPANIDQCKAAIADFETVAGINRRELIDVDDLYQVEFSLDNGSITYSCNTVNETMSWDMVTQ